MGTDVYCTVAKKCSGCQLSNMDYSRQLKYKQNEMRLRFNRLGELKKIVASPEILHYRNKAQFVYRREKNGKIHCGIYQSTTGSIVKNNSCALHTNTQNAIGKATSELLEQLRIAPFDTWRQKGTVKSVIVRESHKNGDIMVVVVCDKRSKFQKETEFSNALVKKFPQIKSIILTQSTTDKLTSGQEPKVIFGTDSIVDSLCGCDFKISYNSFFQINSKQTENLYTTAIDFADLSKNDTVLDAYCGTGTIGIIASKKAGKVYAVEQVENAIKDAKENAVNNNINNIEFVCADSEKYMKELERKGTKLTVAFLDPPRAGCSLSFLKSLARVSPERIVYISCNIDTQIRDIRLLTKLDYKVQKAQGFDMFPYTKHIETVVCLSREKNKDNIRRLILSDIHANIEAFNAVLRDAGSFDEIIFLGDLANFGPNPKECVDLLQKFKSVCIIGNHDQQIISGNPKHWWDKWAKQQLSQAQLDWIASFKSQQIIDGHILLLHGAYTVEYDILPNMPDNLIEEAFKPYLSEGIDEVWFGHYHYQIDRKINGITYRCIRPVGHHRDKDIRASYSIYENGHIYHKRVPYNIDGTILSLKAASVFENENAESEYISFVKNAFSEKLLAKDSAAMAEYAKDNSPPKQITDESCVLLEHTD